MVDLQSIVHFVAQHIGPVLPDLVKGNLEALGTALGIEAAERIKQIWGKLKNAFDSDEELKPIAQLAKTGTKLDYTDLIKQKLGAYLEAHPEVFQELVKSERIVMQIVATKEGEIEDAENVNTPAVPAEQVIRASEKGKIKRAANKIGGDPSGKA